MATPTARPPARGDWQIDALRVPWERIRAWDRDHPVTSDACTTGALLFFCLLVPRRSGLDLTVALIGTALVVPLAWRRRAPEVVFAVIALGAFVQWTMDIGPLAADAALLVALATLAVRSTPTVALTGTGVAMVGVAMASLRWAPPGDFGKYAVFLTGLVITSLFSGIALRSWRSYSASVTERTRRLELERDQQARLAAAGERSRIAREMHDVVAHNVSIMVTLADGALATADAHPGKSKEAMAEVSATGRLALSDMRHLLGVLRTDDGTGDRQPQPGLDGLDRLVDGVRATGLAVDVQRTGDAFVLPPGIELTVFRVVQESLTNILKHADGPTGAEVRLAFEEPYVDVRVRDDGAPPPASVDGHGIDGMRERVAAAGGTVTAGPRSDGGWEVAMRVCAGR